MKKIPLLKGLATCLSLFSVICIPAKEPVLASSQVRFEEVNDFIIVPVLANGKGPFYFVLDTGTSTTIIDVRLAKQLALRPIQNTSMLTVAGSRVLSRCLLDNLTLGPRSVDNLPVGCTDLREIRSIVSRSRGVLGQDFLSRFNYILNYRDRRIEFEENGEFEKQLVGTRLPVERDRGRALIMTQPSPARKQVLRFVLDSGASRVVLFNADSANLGLDIDWSLDAPAHIYAVAGSQMLPAGRLQKLQIGGERLTDLPVRLVQSRAAIEGLPENGVLPTNLFRSVYFNNKENFVILNPRLLAGSSSTHFLSPPVAQVPSSSSAGSYCKRGSALYAMGDFDGAIADFDIAITFDPRWALAYYNRGIARYAKGDLDRAISDFDTAIEIDPRYAAAYCNRGAARQTKGDLNNAIADFDRAIAINPRLAQAYSNRGSARKARGDLDAALADYNRGIQINPRFAEAYNNRGNALQAKGRLEEAISDFDRAIAINPRCAAAYANRGLARMLQGKTSEAGKDFDQCLKLDSSLKSWIEERTKGKE